MDHHFMEEGVGQFPIKIPAKKNFAGAGKAKKVLRN